MAGIRRIRALMLCKDTAPSDVLKATALLLEHARKAPAADDLGGAFVLRAE